MRAFLRKTGGGVGLVLLIGALPGCAGPADAPHPVSLQDVQSIEIHYRLGPWDQVDEVHRLRPGGSRRAFVRHSQIGQGAAAADEAVPAQRVGELLWALSAPPVTRARGVEAVARRVRPAQVLVQASALPRPDPAACTARDRERHLRDGLRGAALRRQLEAYYGPSGWTDDAPALQVVVHYEHAPAQVFHSYSQKLQMLPWVREGSAAGAGAPVELWSVPVSQALLRLLPPSSAAAQRLAAREDVHLVGRIARSADTACSGRDNDTARPHTR